MKKIIYSAMAVAMLATTSCQDDLVNSFVGEEATVEFSISTPEIGTRAFSDGMTVDHVHYAIYEVEGNTLNKTSLHGTEDFNNERKVNITAPLMTGKQYKAIFWADDVEAPYTVTFNQNGAKMEVNYTNVECNDERLDAFYLAQDIKIDGAKSINVQLKRPFAQINVGTSDYQAAKDASYEPTLSSITVPVYTTLDLVVGSVEEHSATPVTFNYRGIPGRGHVFPVEDNTYDYLAMTYALVGEDETAEVTFKYKESETSQEFSRTIGSVPLKRNYRTNIYGALLTGTSDITVTIDPAYETPDFNEDQNWMPVYVNNNGQDEEVEGVLIHTDTKTVTDDEGNTVEVCTFGVENADGLKWISNNLKNEVKIASTRADEDNVYTINGNEIKLLDDIDLSEENWDPIGDNREDDAAFTGVFDGQNHTIKGAHITGDHCFNGAVYGSKEGWGLFSVVDGATIKNLKVDGATFGSYTVITGTIAAYANNTTFENIEIKNTKIAGYNWYTGGVVGWATGECTFKNVKLDETVAVGTLWDSHGQNAGGIAGGVSASAKITIEDCNIACVMDVINDVTSNYKWYIYRVAGMIIGNTNTTEAKYNEVVTATATNVTCKNVTVTYGKWMNYHYCQGFWNRGWGRYESSDYVGGVDQNEPHNHADGEEHLLTLPFDQLFGGSSNGSGHYPVKGLAEFPGVTVVYPAEYTCPTCGKQHNTAE